MSQLRLHEIGDITFFASTITATSSLLLPVILLFIIIIPIGTYLVEYCIFGVCGPKINFESLSLRNDEQVWKRKRLCFQDLLNSVGTNIVLKIIFSDTFSKYFV